MRLTVTNRERQMLVVALDNIVCDYRRSGRRAKRSGSPVIQAACDEAVARYSRLAAKVLNIPARSPGKPRTGKGTR